MIDNFYIALLSDLHKLSVLITHYKMNDFQLT